MEVFGALLDDDDEDESLDSGTVDVKIEGSSDKKKGKAQQKKRKLNPDADAIATVTEEALRELELDPESEDAKKKRRQIRNRLSAQFHRDRKNAYIKTLEDTIEQKDKEMAYLKDELSRVMNENALLRQSMSMVTMSYLNSDSSVNSAAANSSGHTDSESSACHTPSYTESPVIQPTQSLPVENHFSTAPTFLPLTDISSLANNANIPQSYPTIFSGPLLKSLSVLSILCLICLTGLGPLGVQNNGELGEMVTLIPIGVSDPIKIAESTEPFGLSHRRLEEIHEQLPSLLPSHFVMAPPHNLTVPTTNKPKQHLRRSDNVDHLGNVTKSVGDSSISHHRAVYVSKDMVHVDFPNAYKSGWTQTNMDQQSLSHIVMNNGFALFDPSMRFGNDFQASSKVFPVVHSVDHEFNSLKTIEHPFQHNALLPAPPAVKVHSNIHNEEKSLQPAQPTQLSINRWPAITAGASDSHGDMRLDEERLSSSCERERQALLSQFMSKANRVTVTLPASSVRMGKSLSDSTGSTVESIMQLFNLTSLNEDDDMSLLRNTSVDASVEINCIILGAKLILSSPTK